MEWDGGGALERARGCWEREVAVGRVAGDEDAEEGAGMGAGFQETSAGAFGVGRGCSSWGAGPSLNQPPLFSSPGSSATVTPFAGLGIGGRGCALRRRGRGPCCDPGLDRSGDRRRPRRRVRGGRRAAGSGGAGGGARRAGPRGQTGTRTDRLMAPRAPHHHGRGSLLRQWRLLSPRS